MVDIVKASYNPRVLFTLADRALFPRLIPATIRDVAGSQPIRTESGEANGALEQMHATCSRFMIEGPDIVGYWLFKEFCRPVSHLWILDDRKVIPSVQLSIDAIGSSQKPYDITARDEYINPRLELIGIAEHSDWTLKWQTFNSTADISRERAIEPMRDLIGRLRDLPNLRYIGDPSCEQLEQSIIRSSYEFASSIFPDLTDCEASQLFGQTFTATLVREAIGQEI